MTTEKIAPTQPRSDGLTKAEFQARYAASLVDPSAFWLDQAKRLEWISPPTKGLDGGFKDDCSITWFADGTLNASVNCLDRHLASRGELTALIWEGDDPVQSIPLTYRELYQAVCRLANVLQGLGVKRGDRVAIYLPMIPEAVIAMLACARIGAVHSVVFAGFSAQSLADRIKDCASNFVITADEGLRGGRAIPLKANVDAALADNPAVQNVLVVRRTGAAINWTEDRDIWYHDAIATASPECTPAAMNAEDPLFILYTSGSTGKPKGLLHSTGGYLLQCAASFADIFDYRHDNNGYGEIFWCTADIGWITGHSYSVYGPLANGATILIFEGIPTYPSVSRFWHIIDKHKVNIFYTAPTAIRALMREGDAPIRSTSRSSLRVLGSVGEPINPEAWRWYYNIVGDMRCPIVDTWWQTETGAAMITPLAGITSLKPGSASLPYYGVLPVLIDPVSRAEISGAGEGHLCLRHPWPGIARTIYGDHQRYIETYFTTYPGYYFTGDGARRDDDGYYWITGRVDDVINVSGHRIGTAEIESALVAHEHVAEAAVVGFPHEIKGQGIYAYVTLNVGISQSETLRRDLIQSVRSQISAIATPDHIHWAPSLPKTRSGKIMRRILRKIAAGEFESLGDLSTLADPVVVDELIKGVLKNNTELR